MEASQHPLQSCIPLPLLRCLSMALLHNVQLWNGAMGDICSSPPAKSPHNVVLFMCILFQYPSNVKKKYRVCLNYNKGNTVTGNVFTTKAALSTQWHVLLHANQQGRMIMLVHRLQKTTEVTTVSDFMHWNRSGQSLTVSWLAAVLDCGLGVRADPTDMSWQPRGRTKATQRFQLSTYSLQIRVRAADHSGQSLGRF